jgi:hypothetical protein
VSSERLDDHGGRRLHVPGVGLVEVLPPAGKGQPESVCVLEPLSPEQYERLAMWQQYEWPLRKQ